MMKMWRDGYWFYRFETQSYYYIPPGSYKEGELPDLGKLKCLNWMEYKDLVKYVMENEKEGILRTDRTEDLKIIHKALDIIHDGVKGDHSE